MSDKKDEFNEIDFYILNVAEFVRLDRYMRVFENLVQKGYLNSDMGAINNSFFTVAGVKYGLDDVDKVPLKGSKLDSMSEKKDLSCKVVSQRSDLGSLGLWALMDAGFCGPNHDLGDLSVSIYKGSKNYSIHFYYRDCDVGKDHKLYNKIDEAYHNLERCKEVRENE